MQRPALIAGVSLGLAALFGARQALASPPLRILPLGDSITLGYGVPGGYRAPLYTLLTQAGFPVDFVGTQTVNGSATLPDPYHEGHNGWRIDQIDALLPGLFGKLAGPDVILLLIGTNDYGLNYDPAGAAERLEALIVKLATIRPHALLIVANLLVRGEPYNTSIQATFNPRVPEMVERQAALGRLVMFTDMRSAVPLADMPDQLHPNLAGNQKMATNWYTAITSVLAPPRGIPTTLIADGAACRWLVPANDDLGASWTLPTDFDDGAWAAGHSPLGYQSPLSAYTNVIQTWTPASITGLYCRWSFVLPESLLPAPDSLTLRMRVDDGFVAYLNGVPVAQTNAPTPLRFDSSATATHAGAVSMSPVAFNLGAHAGLVRSGTNLLAIHVLNRTTVGPVRGLLAGPELVADLLPPATFRHLQQVTNGTLAIDLDAPPGTAWRIDAAEAPDHWKPVTVFTSASGRWPMQDTRAGSHTQRFYRAMHQTGADAIAGDFLDTQVGPVLLHPVTHASVALLGGGQTIYVDPATNTFTGLPPAELVLFTHEHSDRLNVAALPGLLASNAVILAPAVVYARLSPALQAITVVLTNGATTTFRALGIEAVPAYNTGPSPVHPPGVGNGYVITLGGKRIYISGDSGDTPELRALASIDVAFVALANPGLPPAAAAAAIRAFAPRVVYPCGAWGHELEQCRQAISNDLPIEVRLRQWH